MKEAFSTSKNLEYSKMFTTYLKKKDTVIAYNIHIFNFH